jgi:hypothetical protein
VIEFALSLLASVSSIAFGESARTRTIAKPCVIIQSHRKLSVDPGVGGRHGPDFPYLSGKVIHFLFRRPKRGVG